SSVTRLTVSAACAATAVPTSVDPVKEIFRISGSVLRATLTVRLLLVRTCSTPSGRTWFMSLTRAMVDRGVVGDGLAMTVQPVTRDGASFTANSEIGKFHGVMVPTIP